MADVMTTTTTTKPATRDAKIDARCSNELRARLERIAALKECDLSDIIRDALRSYALRFEQQSAGI